MYKCYALADSLQAYDAHLSVLIVDADTVDKTNAPQNVSFSFLRDIDNETGLKLIKKYKNHKDKLRWSLKSIFLLHLLKQKQQVIYVDNDIFFFNDFKFLFKLLKTHTVLLTPHHYKYNPEKEQNWLEANFRVGLYNAGFVGVNQNAEKVLEWWAKACLYRCEKNYFRGLFDDQKYLDLFPIIEENTHIVRHKGCNVAGWNSEINKIDIVNGKILIANTFSLIFYHFNDYSLQMIDKESPVFKNYIAALKKYKSDLGNLYKNANLTLLDSIKLKIWNILNRLNK
ncbi:MAG: glycosyltransferase [Chitinophagales bacterium]